MCLRRPSQGPMLTRKLDQRTLPGGATPQRWYTKWVNWGNANPWKASEGMLFCLSLHSRWNEKKKLVPFENSVRSTFSCRFGVRIHITCLAWSRTSMKWCSVLVPTPHHDLQLQTHIFCAQMTLNPASRIPTKNQGIWAPSQKLQKIKINQSPKSRRSTKQ